MFENVFIEIAEEVVLEASKGCTRRSKASEVWLLDGKLAHLSSQEVIRRNQVQDPTILAFTLKVQMKRRYLERRIAMPWIYSSGKDDILVPGRGNP